MMPLAARAKRTKFLFGLWTSPRGHGAASKASSALR